MIARLAQLMNGHSSGHSSGHPGADKDQDEEKEEGISDSFSRTETSEKRDSLQTGLELESNVDGILSKMSDEEVQTLRRISDQVFQNDDDQLEFLWRQFLESDSGRSQGQIVRILQHVLNQAHTSNATRLAEYGTRVKYYGNLNTALSRELKKAHLHLNTHGVGGSSRRELRAKFASKRLNVKFRGKVEVDFVERFETHSAEQLNSYIAGIEKELEQLQEETSQVVTRLQEGLNNQRHTLSRLRYVTSFLQGIASELHQRRAS